MPTLSECLQATQLAILQSTKVLSHYHNHTAEVQVQVASARRLIAESQVTLRQLAQVTES